MLAILSQFLVEIIAAVIIVPLTLKYSKVLIRYIKSKRFEARMNKVYEIYDVVQNLRSDLDSERVLLLRTTNGGGLPSPGKVLYASIIAEVVDSNKTKHSIRSEWQNRLVDYAYIRMLETVFMKGQVVNITEDMDNHALLRGAYEKLEIDQTRIVKIGIYNSAFYYISIAEPKGKKLTPSQEYTLYTAIRAIKNLLE